MTRHAAKRRTTAANRAFTLIEILVSSVVLLVLLGVMLVITSGTGTTISRATAHLDNFAAARAAFDLVARRVGRATLNPYYEYFDAQGRAPSDTFYASGSGTAFVPSCYGRQSNLQFLVRKNTQNPGYGQEIYFAAPLAYSDGADTKATPGLLNACGFYVQYSSNADLLPATVATPHARYRLMQAIQPTERLLIFPSVAQRDDSWLTDLGNSGRSLSRCVSPLAENVLVFSVWPRLSEQENSDGSGLTTDYTYDSHPAPTDNPDAQPVTANQLPPVVQITLVVMSEASAAREGGTANQPPATMESTLLNADGSHKFGVSTSTQQQADLNDLSVRLTQHHVSFEIFITSVPMRESRWSSQPTSPR